MAIKLPDEAKKQFVISIKRFFRETMEEDFGDLKAEQVLEFCLEEIGGTLYNQAISDAQTYFHGKVEDLEGSCWEPEFAYWTKNK